MEAELTDPQSHLELELEARLAEAQLAEAQSAEEVPRYFLWPLLRPMYLAMPTDLPFAAAVYLSGEQVL